MKTVFRALALALTASSLAACGVDLDSSTDDLANVPVGSVDGKDDSARRPTAMGSLRVGGSITQRLSRTSGFHLYTLGVVANQQVRLTLKSATYRTYLRVTSAAGTVWNVTGSRDAAGRWVSSWTSAIRTPGTLKVLATSYANMYYGSAMSSGEYTLATDGDRAMCGGIAGFQCPSGQKCLLAGSYPDAAGVCVRKNECRAAVDCAGLEAPACRGQWTCAGGTAANGNIGTCAFRCGATTACADLAVADCGTNPSCEVVATGCENNVCTPESAPCHPCDPIPVCRDKRGQAGETCGTRGARVCGAPFFCAFAIGASCGEADAGGRCSPRPDVCTQQYAPVCGCDGRTYSNACMAAVVGVSPRSSGECAAVSPR